MYRPIRIMALKRELARRIILIEHTRRFDKMGDIAFGANPLMGRALSMKRTFYNIWPSYAREVRISFVEMR